MTPGECSFSEGGCNFLGMIKMFSQLRLSLNTGRKSCLAIAKRLVLREIYKIEFVVSSLFQTDSTISSNCIYFH